MLPRIFGCFRIRRGWLEDDTDDNTEIIFRKKYKAYKLLDDFVEKAKYDSQTNKKDY